MEPLFRFILDSLFPPSHDERIFRTLDEGVLRATCMVRTEERVTTFFSYKDPTIRALIWHLKYKKGGAAAALAAAAIRDAFAARFPHPAFLIPVPISQTRRSERGYAQMALLCHELGRLLPHLTVEAHAIEKIAHTPPQTTHTREERLQNIRPEHFRVIDPARLAKSQLIVFDDVVTTGTTLRALTHVLIAGGARNVTSVALARA